MEITLKISKDNLNGVDGVQTPYIQEKTFTASFISARMLKDTIKLGDLADTKDPDEKMIDDMVIYLVNLFGKQFTADELLDGFPYEDLIPKFVTCVKEVTGKLSSKMGELNSPNA